VKESLGIRTNVKDNTLLMRVNGAIKELEDEKGLVLDGTNPYHLEFVVDYATWKFKNEPMPRHLQFRMHNLIIHTGGGTSGV
jgi:hypothetical protein